MAEAPHKQSRFFPLPRRDAQTLIFVCLVSALGFVPVLRELRWMGLSLFGWWMAALMLFAPLYVLARSAGEEG